MASESPSGSFLQSAKRRREYAAQSLGELRTFQTGRIIGPYAIIFGGSRSTLKGGTGSFSSTRWPACLTWRSWSRCFTDIRPVVDRYATPHGPKKNSLDTTPPNQVNSKNEPDKAIIPKYLPKGIQRPPCFVWQQSRVAFFMRHTEIMPKDLWEKARAKDAAKKAAKRASRHRNKRKRLKPTNAWNPNSKLWFGKHRDVAIKNVPIQYLQWLVNNSQPAKSDRVTALCKFLRSYLKNKPVRLNAVCTSGMAKANQRPKADGTRNPGNGCGNHVPATQAAKPCLTSLGIPQQARIPVATGEKA